MTELEVLNNIDDTLQLLKAIIGNAPVGIQICNAAGNPIYVNEQVCRIFGGPPPPGICVLTDEHARAAGYLHLIERAFGGEKVKLPLFWYDPSTLTELPAEMLEYAKRIGKKAAVETELIPTFDKSGKVLHVVFLFKDVTAAIYMNEERQHALKERDDAKMLIQRVLDNTRAVIYMKDMDGRVTFVNGQYLRIFNKTQSQVIGKTDAELFPKEVAMAFRKNDLQVQNTRTHLEIEELAVHADGSVHTYISLKFPLEDSAGKLLGTCGISTDITQHRQLERELSTAKRMESVGLLAGGIAHDFNNILGIILMQVDLLLMKGKISKSELNSALQAIQVAGNRAAMLTRQLLAFGRRQKISPRVIDMGGLVLGMKDMLEKTLGEDVRVFIDIAPDLWPVRVDPSQIEQVLTNLYLNARDAMPEGGTLRISLNNVTRKKEASALGSAKSDFVELLVSDSGIGMEPAVLDRIFEPFFTTKKEGLGTGLGLASVYGIVQGAGGEVKVDSTPGQGTTFRLFFPRASGPIEELAAKPKKGRVSRGAKETILLVEDQEPLRMLTAAFLRESGYKVIEAGDAASALAKWAELSGKIDLVVADVIMPGLSGLEMVQQMLGVENGAPVRALFVSGYSEEKLTGHNFFQEGYHFIAKPYTALELLAKIQEVLYG
ncbi:MAG: PAS domain-containing protein [Bdellovibrionota bacterium]